MLKLAVVFQLVAAAQSNQEDVIDKQNLHEFLSVLSKYHHRGCATNPEVLLQQRPDLQKYGVEFGGQGATLSEAPTSWDWRNINGTSYVTRTLNQHIPKYCGSCWAHAASSSYSDRLKILRNASWPDIELSVQYALNCLTKAGTCFGGSDLALYELFQKKGAPDETCEVYIADDETCSNAANRCRNCFGPPGQGYCFPQPHYLVYKASSFGYFQNKAANESGGTDQMIQAMKKEIYSRGPISCVVDAETMFDYTAGDILDNNPGSAINHVVSVAGWGVDEASDKEYWIVRNSWGTYWGDHGWMKIATGKNNAFIESFCSWVVPQWPPTDVYVPDSQLTQSLLGMTAKSIQMMQSYEEEQPNILFS